MLDTTEDLGLIRYILQSRTATDHASRAVIISQAGEYRFGEQLFHRVLAKSIFKSKATRSLYEQN